MLDCEYVSVSMYAYLKVFGKIQLCEYNLVHKADRNCFIYDMKLRTAQMVNIKEWYEIMIQQKKVFSRHNGVLSWKDRVLNQKSKVHNQKIRKNQV